MLVTGSIWGTTNALMKRGTSALDRRNRQLGARQSGGDSWLGAVVRDWILLLCTWEYSLPLAINLSASLVFFAKLSESPLSLAVPITNATTFAATAVAGSALGERLRLKQTALGLLLIVAGIWLCCHSARD
ncbi:hypothetical protein SELMODRAFT_89246 [Selaginella moellendorffii]|uniref:EamA domain-containing protein n=2 Tax=Selaginella moellendorffii TaxID=88036 RepID=D8RB53_SELML|nr:hypothetical protein SELMODRAFT_89246 [Selaginella moellendorffii]